MLQAGDEDRVGLGLAPDVSWLITSPIRQRLKFLRRQPLEKTRPRQERVAGFRQSPGAGSARQAYAPEVRSRVVLPLRAPRLAVHAPPQPVLEHA